MTDEDLSQLKIDRSIKTFRPGRKRKFLYLALALFLAAIAGFLYMEGFISPADPVEITTVSQIYPSQSLAQLNATGYVVAQRKAAVASKITGRLVALMVEEGSRVKEGQVIARLENEDTLAARNQADANLKVARANLEEAKADLEDASRAFRRNEELWAKQYIARAEYDTSEARYQKTQAAVAAAEAAVRASSAALQAANVALDYSLIRAPFDAVVLTKNADIGDIVTPIGAAANAKAAVVTIADLNSLEVEADVSENNLAQVRGGQPCEIQFDALPDSRFRGSVHTIVPTVDRTKATITVKIRFLDKDPRILPEMRAKVSFLSRPVSREEEKPRTAVNRSAITRRDGREIVFLIKENRVVETAIKRGALFGEMVEILDGLKAGSRVVNKPPKKLKNGAVIKIVEK
jgi:RND family efflux transporter MFP subunit